MKTTKKTFKVFFDFEKELEIPDVEPEEGSEDNQDTEDDDTNDGDLPQDDDSDGEN